MVYLMVSVWLCFGCILALPLSFSHCICSLKELEKNYGNCAYNIISITDFLELTLQFGMIMMFACAFPLIFCFAALVCGFCHKNHCVLLCCQSVNVVGTILYRTMLLKSEQMHWNYWSCWEGLSPVLQLQLEHGWIYSRSASWTFYLTPSGYTCMSVMFTLEFVFSSWW